jgi:carboxyl-terminal processing protease
MRGSFGGIGAQLRIAAGGVGFAQLSRQNRKAMERGGVDSNCVIRSVDGRDARGMDVSGVNQLLHGVTGTEAKVTLAGPDGTPRELTLERGGRSSVSAELCTVPPAVFVQRVEPGSPAERAGIAPGTRIVSVNGVAAADKSLDEVVDLIRGPAGSALKLGIAEPGREARTLTLVREQVLVGRPESRMLPEGFGLLKPQGFNQETPALVRALVEDLEARGAKGLVLDLRGNQGGTSSALFETAALFLDAGRVVWLYEDSVTGARTPVRTKTAGPLKLPVAMLVDAQTLGSELVAAALQRNGRALAIGQRTTGATLAKNLVRKPDGSSETVVAGRYLRSDGRPISGVGVEPDVALPANAKDADFLRAALNALGSGGLPKPVAP